MHEMSLMASVFEIAERELQDIPVERVVRVKLQVGKLANALDDALQMAFEAMSRNTVFEGALLELEEVPAVWRCRQCLHEFSGEIGMTICPLCDSLETELIRGGDLVLESLEVE